MCCEDPNSIRFWWVFQVKKCQSSYWKSDKYGKDIFFNVKVFKVSDDDSMESGELLNNKIR